MMADDRRPYCDLRSAIIWKPALTEQVGKAFKLKQRIKNFTSHVNVLHKTLNLAISRCCLAEHGEELYENL